MRQNLPARGPKGCSVYEDRPWSCRMFPLGVASPKDDGQGDAEDFYFIIEEPVCKGYFQEKSFTVQQWLTDQKVEEYDEMGKLFKTDIIARLFSKRQKA